MNTNTLRKVICLIIFLAGFISSYSQTINVRGVWQGKLSQDDKSWAFDMTVTLQQKGNTIFGTSRIVTADGSGVFVVHNIEGRINANDINLIDISIESESNSSGNSSWCKKKYSGTTQITNDTIFLSGNWGNDERKLFRNKELIDYSFSYCAPGTFRLFKTSELPGDVEKKNASDVSPIVKTADKTFLSRQTEIKSTISVTSDSVRLLFFDNGSIDNDTISIYYNKELILSHQRLSNKPIEVTVKLLPGKDNEILMFAENEGTTPPNTALMVFYDKGLRQEITIDSSTKKSEVVVLKKIN